MSENPLVSVLMTAYNREKFIREAIESVLASSYPNFELIIVDDCSTDNTSAIVKNFESIDPRVKTYSNETNLGDYPNRNKAASYAKGKYLKYLDSDDKLYPYSLEIMVHAMESYPDAKLGLSYFKIQDDTKAFPILFSPEEAYSQHFLKGGLLFAGPSASIINAAYFRQTGGFSGKRFVSDTEFWLKIAQRNSILILQPSLIWWRTHDEQEFNLGHINEDYVKLNYELNKNFLEHISCPLSEKDRLIAVRNYKNRFARKIYKKIFRAKFAKAYMMKKYSGISLPDILQALIPINRIKRFFIW